MTPPPVSETAAWTEQDERDLQNYATLDIGNLPIGVPEVVLDAAKLARYALRLREKIRGLNRRCQSAESGLAAKPTSGPNMGRAFANAAATMYRNQLDEAKAELARLRAENERLRQELGETLDARMHKYKADQLDALVRSTTSRSRVSDNGK